MEREIENLKEKILRLKEEKDVLILAHFYANSEVQEIADKVGDSFQLAKDAQNAKNKIICFCGVNFMGESAKLLNPDKKILIPDIGAGCPMADMVNLDDLDGIKERYDDVAIVSYINTKADVKSRSDVCVTSSNAMKIVSALPNLIRKMLKLHHLYAVFRCNIFELFIVFVFIIYVLCVSVIVVKVKNNMSKIFYCFLLFTKLCRL